MNLTSINDLNDFLIFLQNTTVDNVIFRPSCFCLPISGKSKLRDSKSTKSVELMMPTSRNEDVDYKSW